MGRERLRRLYIGYGKSNGGFRFRPIKRGGRKLANRNAKPFAGRLILWISQIAARRQRGPTHNAGARLQPP